MAKHEYWELKQMQCLPLYAKIQMTRRRILTWVDEFGEDGVYISFSGGKDSTVLLDIARKDHPNMKAVFFDTGLEYPKIREFVKTFDNVDWIKPKMNFRQVIEKYGYPMISKEVSECVQGARRYLKQMGARSTDTSMISYADRASMRNMSKGGQITGGVSFKELASIVANDKSAGVQIKMVLGLFTKENQTMTENTPSVDMSRFNCEKYKYFLNAPFEISKECCSVMKKRPAHSYGKKTGRKPITAQMADESRLRLQKWLQYGCNAFDSTNPISNPMSFWTEQDVLRYIHDNNLPIAEPYGDIIVKGTADGQMDISDLIGDYRCCEFETTGCDRTGCCFCGFGIMFDLKRYVKLAELEPKICDFVMRGGEFVYSAKDNNGNAIDFGKATKSQIANWCRINKGNARYKITELWQPNNEGMGFWFVIEWINVHGNAKIEIPNREYYIAKYSTPETEKYLKSEAV